MFWDLWDPGTFGILEPSNHPALSSSTGSTAMRRRRWVATGVLAALVLAGCGAPQLGPDREAFKTVDALYTAVSLRDPAQLERCGSELKKLLDDGKLPEAAYRSLEGILVDAREARWEPARRRLRDFMLAQRP
jgi:hypothetical protein